jgi:hypothetical protein
MSIFITRHNPDLNYRKPQNKSRPYEGAFTLMDLPW